MSKHLVALIDGTTARFLTLEPVEFEGYESGPNLVERGELRSAENELQGQELWSTTKTGRNRGAGGQSHSYDDGREDHMVEFERRFAQKITQRLLELIQTHESRQLILVAEPQILGLMREEINGQVPSQVKLSELSKDLHHYTPREVHDYLATRQLLPAFQRAVT
jgi:protein required for attachment to host cells